MAPGASIAKMKTYMAPEASARPICFILILSIAAILYLVNMVLPDRKGAWTASHQFALHAYEKNMSTSTQFAGPFMSTVYVLPSVRARLTDESPSKHVHCTSKLFYDKKQMDKCKMMRSAPIYLGNVTNSWSVLGAQSTRTLTNHIFVIFLVFLSFWLTEYALADHAFTHKWNVVWLRNIVVFVAVIAFVILMATNVTSDMSKDAAIGSVSTSFAFVVISLLIICFEYAGMNGKKLVLYESEQPTGKEMTSEVNVAQDAEQGEVENADAQRTPNQAHQNEKPDEINKPQKEHMHRNIYLSYASLLMLPLVVVFILSQKYTAIVDVHIQLVFFSFVFYATLDVFQTRTTAVLLCLKDEPNNGPDLHFLNLFVVLAFVLCKCFALMPALVLLATLYTNHPFQEVTLPVHYVVLIGFAVADLVHIVKRYKYVDALKLLVMLVYTGFIFIGIAFVDK